MKTRFLHLVLLVLFLGTSSSLLSQLPTHMGIIGTVSPYGYSSYKALPMIQDENNSSVFHYDAWLEAGAFKFIAQTTDPGANLPTWGKVPDTEDRIYMRSSESEPDYQFTIAEAGNYSITIDLDLLTCSVESIPLDDGIPFNTVYMVGNAGPVGNFSIPDAAPLKKDPDNPYNLVYEGPLNKGLFSFVEIRTAGWGQTGNRGVRWLTRREPDNNYYDINTKETWPQWNISTPGDYRIVLNQTEQSVTISESVPSSTKEMEKRTPIIINLGNQLKISERSDFSYSIFNYLGAKVLSGFSSSGLIDITNLNSGIFIVNIEDSAAKFIVK